MTHQPNQSRASRLPTRNLSVATPYLQAPFAPATIGMFVRRHSRLPDRARVVFFIPAVEAAERANHVVGVGGWCQGNPREVDADSLSVSVTLGTNPHRGRPGHRPSRPGSQRRQRRLAQFGVGRYLTGLRPLDVPIGSGDRDAPLGPDDRPVLTQAVAMLARAHYAREIEAVIDRYGPPLEHPHTPWHQSFGVASVSAVRVAGGAGHNGVGSPRGPGQHVRRPGSWGACAASRAELAARTDRRSARPCARVRRARGPVVHARSSDGSCPSRFRRVRPHAGRPGGLMGAQPTPRARLQTLVARHGLCRETLTLSAKPRCWPYRAGSSATPISTSSPRRSKRSSGAAERTTKRSPPRSRRRACGAASNGSRSSGATACWPTTKFASTDTLDLVIEAALVRQRSGRGARRPRGAHDQRCARRAHAQWSQRRHRDRPVRLRPGAGHAGLADPVLARAPRACVRRI